MTIEYAAGLFDGEGCIQISRNKSGGTPNKLRLQVSLRNTHQLIVRSLQVQFGGSVVKVKAKDKRAACWYWSCTSRLAANFLSVVIPHLIIKAKEAEIALEFQSTMRQWQAGRCVLSDKELEARQTFADRLKHFKRSYKEYEVA